MVAHKAISHIAVLVVSEKYDADQSKVVHAVVHNHHVSSAVHSLARRLASQNTRAPAMPVINAGISPGTPSQIPGTSVRAWAGGDFAKTGGPMKTGTCPRKAPGGGGGAAQMPAPQISPGG